MKTLILMRHAHADSPEPRESDRERRLNARGQSAAELMGSWLKNEGYVPDAALVSGAARTRETWELMGPLCSAVEFQDDLYLCGPETILEALQNAPDCKCLLILGHNPGIASAMTHLADTPRYFESPPATTVVYKLPLDSWHDASPGIGHVIAHETPTTLLGR